MKKEEWLDEFENLTCVSYAMSRGTEDNPCDCGDEKCRHQQTPDMAKEEYTAFFNRLFAEIEKEIEAAKAEERELIIKMAESLEINPDNKGDITNHALSETYDTKLEAFYYGHNDALDKLVFTLRNKK